MKLGDADLSDARLFRDGIPHDYFAFLRREAPVSYQPKADGGGFWSVVKHADIREIELDWQRFSSSAGVAIQPQPPAFQEMATGHMPIWTDPPRHTFLRKIISRTFTPRALIHLEEAMRDIAARAVDEVIEEGHGDFLTIAMHMPIEVIAEMLGVPTYDRARMFDWTEGLFGLDDPDVSDPATFSMAAMEMFAYARRLAVQRRADPQTDIYSAIASASEDGEQLSDIDLGMFFLLLVIAGNETTRTLLLQGMHTLIEHPAAMAELIADPSLLPAAVEEMLRFASPVMCFGRTTTEDVRIRGVDIPAGEQVIMWYVSANRDEDIFTDPSVFDIHRANASKHLAFGGGPHFCLGAQLAKVEARVQFDEVLRRMPDVSLAGPVERLQSNFTNGIKSLPIRFSPGPRVTQKSSEERHTTVETQRSLPPAPELIHLASATLDLGVPIFVPNGPKGTRIVAEIVATSYDGERLRARQIGVASADWALVSDAGIAAIDVRTTLETEDGAIIFVSYTGRTDYSQAGAAPLYVAPTFETGDPRYAWLNGVQAVARGYARELTQIRYEIYEVR
jgi:cytochrome P450